MDKRPFFVFDLQKYDDQQVNELSRFQKENFAIEDILEAASNLKYVKSAAAFLTKQLTASDDEFVRYVGRQIFEGTITKSVVEQLRPAVQSALDEVIRNRIQDKLNVTFGQEAPQQDTLPEKKIADDSAPSDIETKDDERFAFMIVQAIGAKVVNVDRITMRDAKSYCSVLVDDNNRKPVCRFYFNAKNSRSLGFFGPDKSETKVVITALSDIYKYSTEIEAAISAFR